MFTRLKETESGKHVRASFHGVMSPSGFSQPSNKDDDSDSGQQMDSYPGSVPSPMSYTAHQSSVFIDKAKAERNALRDAQSVSYTAYTMNMDSGHVIVKELRNVGVTVLSLETLSSDTMVQYMDAVTTMRIGNDLDDKCMLYTDRMGRVFNVIVSGGSEGLAQAWTTSQAAYSGWIAIAIVPFTFRVLVAYNRSTNSVQHSDSMALQPGLLFFIFAFILQNEISHAWLTVCMSIRGSSSVGAHVWRTGSLTDYPRLLCLLSLALASFIPTSEPSRDILTLVGTGLGALLLLANLGGRSWKKLNMGCIDSNSFLSPIFIALSSILTGLIIPYLALGVVHGGLNDHDGSSAVEKTTTVNNNGKRARQHVLFAAVATAVLFSGTDVEVVQRLLGFDFSSNRGYVNIGVGTWWLFSTFASLSLCHKLDASQNKKIEPFLRREETSPVGWIVPSIPNIIIDPNLGKGQRMLPWLSFGSDVIIIITVVILAALIIWQGIQQVLGFSGGKTVWDIGFI